MRSSTLDSFGKRLERGGFAGRLQTPRVAKAHAFLLESSHSFQLIVCRLPGPPRRWEITRTLGLEIKRKLAEKSNDFLCCIRTANISMGTASVPP
jgi:hypothetical protein